MAEVTHYIALPFVAAGDGIAAGELAECFNPIAVVMRVRYCRSDCPGSCDSYDHFPVLITLIVTKRPVIGKTFPGKGQSPSDELWLASAPR
jgi:hypothetical protein